jgi:hypothetical protein
MELNIFNQNKKVNLMIWNVYIDSMTRFGGMSPNGSINFLEFLNNCHPYTEALRKSLKTMECTKKFKPNETEIVLNVVNMIIEINLFVDKWSASYTGWLSAFKTKNNEAKNIINNSNEWVYEELQSFYRNSEDLYSDISNILNKIRKLIIFCETHLALKRA